MPYGGSALLLGSGWGHSCPVSHSQGQSTKGYCWTLLSPSFLSLPNHGCALLGEAPPGPPAFLWKYCMWFRPGGKSRHVNVLCVCTHCPLGQNSLSMLLCIGCCRSLLDQSGLGAGSLTATPGLKSGVPWMWVVGA